MMRCSHDNIKSNEKRFLILWPCLTPGLGHNIDLYLDIYVVTISTL